MLALPTGHNPSGNNAGDDHLKSQTYGKTVNMHLGSHPAIRFFNTARNNPCLLMNHTQEVCRRNVAGLAGEVRGLCVPWGMYEFTPSPVIRRVPKFRHESADAD